MNTGEVYSLIEEGGITKHIMMIVTACNLGVLFSKINPDSMLLQPCRE